MKLQLIHAQLLKGLIILTKLGVDIYTFIPKSAKKHSSRDALLQKQREQVYNSTDYLHVLQLIPHYIINNKNDWLKSMGYIAS